MNNKQILRWIPIVAICIGAVPNLQRHVMAFSGQHDVRLDNPAVRFSPAADISIRVKDSSVKVDGEMIFQIGGETGGFVIWFYSPKYGRFIFSTRPHPKYEFEQVDVTNNNRIAFSFGGKQFEWLFGEPLVENGGVTHLWMLHDKHPEPIKDKKQDSGEVGAATHYEYLLPRH